VTKTIAKQFFSSIRIRRIVISELCRRTMVSSRLLLTGRSKRRFYSSHSIVNLVVYLCAKFGALNPRINNIRSIKNWWRQVPEVWNRIFSIPTIFWLSVLVSMRLMALRTIMDSILHSSSHLYASRLRGGFKFTLKMEIFIKEYISLIQLLRTIFNVAFRRILSKIRPCIGLCSFHRYQNNFCFNSSP
jgi:hypothetical protein